MSAGTTFNQRDIVLIPFPHSDLSTTKKRPALILSNKQLKGDDLICCMVTSKKSEEGMVIDDYEEGTLPFTSYIKPHRVFSVHQKIMIKTLCRLPAKTHQRCLKRLNEYLQ